MAPPLSRRTLLLAAAAPAPRIVDTHTHFYDPSRPGGVPWPPRTDSLLYRTVLPRDFKRVTAGLGVLGTVVVEASPLVEDNQWILDLAKDEPAILGFIGRLDPGASDFETNLRRFARNPLFRGIRLNAQAIASGLGQQAFRDGLRRLGERGLTLDAIGPAAMFPDLARVLDAAPGLKIVIDHLPFDRQPGLPRDPRIWAKVSGVRPDMPDPVIEEVWRAFGRERVIYGSNWPVSERAAPYAETLARVRAFFRARGAEDAYLAGNARQAYGLTAIPQ